MPVLMIFVALPRYIAASKQDRSPRPTWTLWNGPIRIGSGSHEVELPGVVLRHVVGISRKVLDGSFVNRGVVQ